MKVQVQQVQVQQKLQYAVSMLTTKDKNTNKSMLLAASGTLNQVVQVYTDHMLPYIMLIISTNDVIYQVAVFPLIARCTIRN